MMKIVYVTPYRTKLPSREANSINIMRMCEATAELGHKLILLTSYRDINSNIFKFYGVKESFKIRKIKSLGLIDKRVFYCLRAFNIACFLKPDMVIGRSTQVCALTAMAGIPTVYDSHYPVWENGCISMLSYWLLRKGKGFKGMTTNSVALRRMYEHKGLSPQCGIVVAHNGSLEQPIDDVVSDWPGRKHAFQVGYVGHLYPGRGMEIICACASVMYNFDFHVIGGEDNDIEFWKNQADLPNLFFHGYISHSMVYKYRNICDVLLAPYQENNVAVAGGEGDHSRFMCPIKIIEYMSSKKPIISSNLPVLREVLQHERNALLCSSEDIQAWKRALERIKSDPSLARKLGENAYKDFVANYTWRARTKKLLGLHQDWQV